MRASALGEKGLGMNKKLVLIRGLPGSGKSTKAKVLADIGFAHFEADMYFVKDGKYLFDHSLIKDAHSWCQMQADLWLRAGHDVVVSNTFVRVWEMSPYFEIARNAKADLLVLHATGNYQSEHDVPDDVIQRMRVNWESYRP